MPRRHGASKTRRPAAVLCRNGFPVARSARIRSGPAGSRLPVSRPSPLTAPPPLLFGHGSEEDEAERVPSAGPPRPPVGFGPARSPAASPTGPATPEGQFAPWPSQPLAQHRHGLGPLEFRKRSEYEDSFDYVGSSSSWTRSSSKRDLRLVRWLRMRGSRTDPVDISSDGSADSGSDENSDSGSDGCGDSFSDEGVCMNSDEGAYISSDEGRYMGFDEGEDSSLDEGVYSSSDEDTYTSSNEGAHTTAAKGVHRRMKEKKPRMLCMAVCNCPKDYTVGYNPNSNAKWMYSKKFKMSMCARERLSHYVESVEPAISHYVCELN